MSAPIPRPPRIPVPRLAVALDPFVVPFTYATRRRTTVSLDVRSAYVASWRITRDRGAVDRGTRHPGPRRQPAAQHLGDGGRQRAHGHRAYSGVVARRASRLLARWRLGLRLGTGGAHRRVTHRVHGPPGLSGSPRPGQPVAALSAPWLGFTTPTWTVAANGIWPHTVTMLGIAG